MAAASLVLSSGRQRRAALSRLIAPQARAIPRPPHAPAPAQFRSHSKPHLHAHTRCTRTGAGVPTLKPVCLRPQCPCLRSHTSTQQTHPQPHLCLRRQARHRCARRPRTSDARVAGAAASAEVCAHPDPRQLGSSTWAARRQYHPQRHGGEQLRPAQRLRADAAPRGERDASCVVCRTRRRDGTRAAARHQIPGPPRCADLPPTGV